MNRIVDWVTARTYATRFEADMAQARVEASDIPSRIQSHAADGAFGASFQGHVPGGVSLLVPSDRLDEVGEILGDDGDATGDAE